MGIATLNPAQALSQILDVLQRMRQDIQALRPDKPITRAEPQLVRIFLNEGNTGQQVALATAFDEIYIGGDSAGEAILNISGQQMPFWVPSYETIVYSVKNPFICRNDRVSYTPPNGTTNWDVTLIGRAINVDQSGAR